MVYGVEIYNRDKDLPLHEEFSQFSPSLPYHQMLKEGKRWNYKTVDLFLDLETYFSMELHGDTLIGGKSCMKMYRIKNGLATYSCAWYENDKKIYFIEKGSESFLLKYDFNRLNHYDVMPCTEDDPTDFPKYLVGVDIIKTSSAYLNRYRYGIYEGDDYSFCVEGVGGPEGLPMPWFQIVSNERTDFLSCEEDGICLCTKEEMSGEAVDPSTVSIGDAMRLNDIGESNSNIIYDLSGRRVDGKKPGVYIKNGKKVVIK